MRENFSPRILVRYTMNAWKMLVPKVAPAPKPTRHPGRVQVVLGGTARETRVLNLSEAEAEAEAEAPTPRMWVRVSRSGFAGPSRNWAG
ncbi:hypothetical protein ACF1BN_22020 [Streptomyces sp. NPDC014861]|uniref:hypothetical protein n=1 Tax=Streptomyces sp. NPDC014861 TaxID=3364923 RepID=UPI0036FE8F70